MAYTIIKIASSLSGKLLQLFFFVQNMKIKDNLRNIFFLTFIIVLQKYKQWRTTIWYQNGGDGLAFLTITKMEKFAMLTWKPQGRK